MSGTLGDISTFSFFGNKTITTGEGGMVLCKNLEHYNKIKKLKDVPSNLLETNRKGFVNGYHKIIQKCHIDNEPWVNVKVKDLFKQFKWPFYFLDIHGVGWQKRFFRHPLHK